MGQEHEQRKRQLRRELRTRRREIAQRVAAELSRAACTHLVSLPAFKEAKGVVGYVATDGEVDPATALAKAVADGRRVYFPRLVGSVLEFMDGAPNGSAPGPHGVPDPDGGDALKGDGAGIAILVPGVGFDHAGGRLGRGGGHYDRALARFASATRIGLAYDDQLVPELPQDPWDCRMDFVATATQVVAAARGRPHTKEIQP